MSPSSASLRRKVNGGREVKIGKFKGELSSEFCERFEGWSPDELAELIAREEEGLIAAGRHRVVVLPFELRGGVVRVAVKAFGRQGRLKDRYDARRGSKAARSFRAADFLTRGGAGTPTPIGYLERWEGGRLAESYYLSVYVEGLLSFKDELVMLYREDPRTERLVSLLRHVAGAIRAMHDVGFCHRDLGNQNIELERPQAGEMWGRVCFIDLNRGRMREGLSAVERARDFARIRIPGAFFDVFVVLYWGGSAPKSFLKKMGKMRRRFRRWEATRKWRHPFRKSQQGPGLREMKAKDIWVWDEKTAQASVMLNRMERQQAHSKSKYLSLAKSVLSSGGAVWRNYGELLPQAFSKRVSLAGKIGMSLEMADLDLAKQVDFLDELGKIPVLVRFCHHEGREQWERSLEDLARIHARGHALRVAILQDRRAVLEPDSWREFLECVLPNCAELVEGVEICHAVNRSKWGVHSPEEQAQLLEPVVDILRRFPQVKVTGPACIDFEYHFVIAALDKTPRGLRYEALSHHLYVDRRGAPENKQGVFGVVEKCALLRAIARYSPHCEERVIISEVNWPVKGSGIYSPVDATFMSAEQPESQLNVSEKDYGSFMLRYLVLALCSGYVDEVYWWRLVAHGFGLVDERAEGGWRARPGFAMLKYFLETLGDATFIQRLETEEDVYALRFEVSDGELVMGWVNGGRAAPSWSLEGAQCYDAFGNEQEAGELSDEPSYFFFPRSRRS